MTFILQKRLRITVSNNYNYQIRRRKKSNKKSGLHAVIIIGVTALFAIGLCVFLLFYQLSGKGRREIPPEDLPPIDLTVKLLDPNPYSRPGISLERVKGIVVHYTANPGTDAMANRNYFNNLPSINRKKEKDTYASSHFVIDIDGEIVQCIPTNEIAYASNDRNKDTISIECCHRRKSGKFTSQTYESLVELTTYLCLKFGLTEDDIIRHYDITGKNCPKYFVEHPDAWNQFLTRIKQELAKQNP